MSREWISAESVKKQQIDMFSLYINSLTTALGVYRLLRNHIFNFNFKGLGPS